MTKIVTVKSNPVQVGPAQHVIIESNAVHILTEEDLKTLLKLMGEGHELKDTFVWGEMTIAITQTITPSKLAGLTINNRRPQL